MLTHKTFIDYMRKQLEKQWEKNIYPKALILPIEGATLFGLPMYASKAAYDKEQEAAAQREWEEKVRKEWKEEDRKKEEKELIEENKYWETRYWEWVKEQQHTHYY